MQLENQTPIGIEMKRDKNENRGTGGIEEERISGRNMLCNCGVHTARK